jgi:hypothetical protein
MLATSALAPLLGTASSYARHLSEDADSATARESVRRESLSSQQILNC